MISGPLRQIMVAVEEQISAARRAFNAAVLQYNNALEMFPTNLIAGIMRFQRRTFFQVGAEEQQPVQINFSDGGRRSSRCSTTTSCSRTWRS